MSLFDVEKDAIPVGLLGNASVTIANVAGDTLYYADNSQVSSTNSQGTLAANASATFTQGVWVVSATRSTVSTTFTAPATGGGGSGTLAGDTDAAISSPTEGQDLIFTSGKWSNIALRPQHLGAGGFRRIQNTALLDLGGSSLSIRNPRGFKKGGTHYVLFDSGNNQGLSEASANIGWAKGPSLTSLTSQGTLINASAFSSFHGGVLAALSPSCIIDDTAGSTGLYHQYAQAVDTWNSGGPNVGAIYHQTASSPSGPWSAPVVALEQSGSTIYTDTCGPVFYGGQWVMPLMVYTASTGGSGRTLRFATSSSLNGPWTVAGSSPTLQGGGSFTGVDGPCCLVDGEKLYLYFSTSTYFQVLVEFTNGSIATGNNMGTVLNVDKNDTVESNGLATWGQGSIYRGQDDGQIYALWEGISSPQSTSYYKLFGGTWVPGHIYVPRQPGSWDATTVALANGNNTLSFSSLNALPVEAIAVDLSIDVWESGTFTANEFISVDPGFASKQLIAWPPNGGQPTNVRGRVELNANNAPGTWPSVRVVGASLGTAKMNWTLEGYWRLP